MSTTRRYTLTITCPDRAGIIAAVSGFIAQHGGFLALIEDIGRSGHDLALVRRRFLEWSWPHGYMRRGMRRDRSFHRTWLTHDFYLFRNFVLDNGSAGVRNWCRHRPAWGGNHDDVDVTRGDAHDLIHLFGARLTHSASPIPWQE